MKFSILLISFTVVALLCATTVVHSQDSIKHNNKNTIEIFFSLCHYFDQTNTNWTILVPHPRGSLQNKKVIPPHLGINYSFRYSRLSSIRLSAFMYGISYFGTIDTGQVFQRMYYIFSIGHNFCIYNKNNFQLKSVAEINYRNGNEIIFIYKPNWWENHVEDLPVNDLGLSFGYNIALNLPFNFHVLHEMTFTRYIYRSYEGVNVFGITKKSTPNTLSIKLGLGYEF